MTTEWIRQGDLKRLETLSSGKKDQKEPKAPAVKCGKCGKTGHLDRDCWSKQRSGSTSKVNLQQGGSNMSSTAKDKCPVCSLVHKYSVQGNEHVSKRLGECVEFLNLSIDDWAEKIKQLKGCVIWLDYTGTHQRDTCRIKDWWKCKDTSGGQDCKLPHHQKLHGSSLAYCNTIRVMAATLSFDSIAEKLLEYAEYSWEVKHSTEQKSCSNLNYSIRWAYKVLMDVPRISQCYIHTDQTSRIGKDSGGEQMKLCLKGQHYLFFSVTSLSQFLL